MDKGLFRILKSYLKTRYWNRFSSRNQLEEWQDIQVRNHLQKILTASPFYKKHYSGLSLNDWKNFPTIDKAIMMENFDRLNTVNISKEEALEIATNAEQKREISKPLNGITIGLSSGTSGNRGIFAVSDNERFEWAGTFLAKILPSSILKSHRLALFLRSNSSLYTSTRGKNIQFEYFDLLHPIDELIKRLNSYSPTTILAPPSMLRFLAKAKEEKKLHISPEKIISIAEVLDPIDDAYLSYSFSQTVHQVYQCTEGFLAVTCQHGTLHINEDLVAIQKEYLDDSKTKFMPIITDFRRATQPIIRYRLNDILTEKQSPCPCGSVFVALEKIEGRSDDIFYLPNKQTNLLMPIFPDFIRQAIVSESPEVQEYLAVQKSRSQIQITLRLNQNFIEKRTEIERKVQENLNKLCDLMGGQHFQIQFMHDFPAYDGKKLRRVKRDFVL